MNSASEKRTSLRQAQADILLSCWACRNMELVETWSLSKHGACRNMQLVETCSCSVMLSLSKQAACRNMERRIFWAYF